MTCLISPPKPRPFIPELPEALSIGFLVSKIPGAEKLISAGNGKPGELPAMRMGPWGAAALFATVASAAYEWLGPKTAAPKLGDEPPYDHYTLPTDPATGRLTGLPTVTDTGEHTAAGHPTIVSGVTIPDDMTSTQAIILPGFTDFLQGMMQETRKNYETREYWQRLVDDLHATPDQQAAILTVVGRIALGANWVQKQWPGNFWYLTRSLFKVASAHGFDPIADVARLRDPTGEFACDWMCVQMDSDRTLRKQLGTFEGDSAWNYFFHLDPYLGILEDLMQAPMQPGDPVGRYALISTDLMSAVEALKSALRTPSEPEARIEDLQLLVRMGYYDPQMQAALLYWAAGMPGAPLDAIARRESLYVTAKWVRELRGRGVIVYGDVLGMHPAQAEVLRETADAGDRVFVSRNTFEILKPGPEGDLDAAEVLAMLLSRRKRMHPHDRPAFIRAVADVPGGQLRDAVRELLTPETSRDQIENTLNAAGLNEIVDKLQQERKVWESKIPPSDLPDRYKIWASVWMPFLDGDLPIDPASPVLQALGNDYRNNTAFRMATDALMDRLKGESKMFFHLPIAAQIYRLQLAFMGDGPVRAWSDFLKTAFSVFRDIGGRKAGDIQDILNKTEAEILRDLFKAHLTPAEVRALFASALDYAIRDFDAREVRIARLIYKYAPAGVIFWEDFQEDLHVLLNPAHPRMIAQTWELVKDMGAANKIDSEVWLRVREAQFASYPKMKTVVHKDELKVVVPPIR